MDKDLYLIELRKAWMLAYIVKDIPLRDMITAADNASSAVWFTDPTLALDTKRMKKFEQDRKLLYALIALQNVIEEFEPVESEMGIKVTTELELWEKK